MERGVWRGSVMEAKARHRDFVIQEEEEVSDLRGVPSDTMWSNIECDKNVL